MGIVVVGNVCGKVKYWGSVYIIWNECLFVNFILRMNLFVNIIFGGNYKIYHV